MNKLYISVDIECDSGYSSPATSNMWEIGCIFLDEENKEVDAFESYIKLRENVNGDPRTIEWLKSNKLYDNYSQCKLDHIPSPTTVMNNLAKKLKFWSNTHKLVFVCGPASYDFMYLKYYYDSFLDFGNVEENAKYKDLLGYSAKCISTTFSLLCILQNVTNDKSHILWDQLKGEFKHTHRAIDDAREQGNVYMNMLKKFKSFAADRL
jgi:inhibitor of KinA sporulation pathway (predicted exonuclease)